MTARLVARTAPLDEPRDLLASGGLFWRDEETCLAGVGEAVRIELRGGMADVGAVGEALSGIEVDDEVGLPGCGAIAIGALPFDPASRGHLVVPRKVFGRSRGRAWVTTIGPAGATDEPPPVASPAGEAPDGFELSSPLPHAAWRRLIADAVGAIEACELDKVVLARRVEVSANRPFVIPDVLQRLVALYPSCMVFSIGGFIGASPELLMSRRVAAVASHPMAGTVARSGDSASDDALVAGLLGSAKDRQEHQFVVDTLAGALAPLCESLDVPATPSVLGLRNVSHLVTAITGRLAPTDGRLPSALELVAGVHPTPAVAGTPTTEAVKYLQAVEGFDRGCYAGPVGWVDAAGDGRWAVGIRSAQVERAHATLYAGVGVVAGSDPDAELAETQLKLQALLAALVRP
ncbi:MAG: isochorismate synthase [Acidimicrobiales bacterium]